MTFRRSSLATIRKHRVVDLALTVGTALAIAPGCRVLTETSAASPAGRCGGGGAAFGPRHIGPGQYLMLGDNRALSFDSRCGGVIKRSQIIGRAFAICWPPTRIQGI